MSSDWLQRVLHALCLGIRKGSKYLGLPLCRNLHTSTEVLKIERYLIGNQYSAFLTGVMWEYLVVLATILARLFWTHWSYPDTEQPRKRGSRVYLYYTRNNNVGHFDCIVNIKGILGKGYFCHHCFKGFNSNKEHTCEVTCQICHSTSCKKKTLSHAENAKLLLTRMPASQKSRSQKSRTVPIPVTMWHQMNLSAKKL